MALHCESGLILKMNMQKKGNCYFRKVKYIVWKQTADLETRFLETNLETNFGNDLETEIWKQVKLCTG